MSKLRKARRLIQTTMLEAAADDRRVRLPVGLVDYAALAAATHALVCELTGRDGYGDCLSYACLGAAWLNRHTDQPHALAGGRFVANLDAPGLAGCSFTHFWVMRGRPGAWHYIDLASRHNGRFVADGLRKRRKLDERSAALAASLSMPWYAGPGGDPEARWHYALDGGESRHAQAEYHRVGAGSARDSYIAWLDDLLAGAHTGGGSRPGFLPGLVPATEGVA